MIVKVESRKEPLELEEIKFGHFWTDPAHFYFILGIESQQQQKIFG